MKNCPTCKQPIPEPSLLDRILDAQMVCHQQGLYTGLVAYLGNVERDQLIADISTPWLSPGDFYGADPGMQLLGMTVVFVNKKTWLQVTREPDA